MARVQVTGTHKGEFLGVPPAGARVDVQLIDIMRFDGAGLVCEHWGVADMLSLMQQHRNLYATIDLLGLFRQVESLVKLIGAERFRRKKSSLSSLRHRSLIRANCVLT